MPTQNMTKATWVTKTLCHMTANKSNKYPEVKATFKSNENIFLYFSTLVKGLYIQRKYQKYNAFFIWKNLYINAVSCDEKIFVQIQVYDSFKLLFTLAFSSVDFFTLLF